MQHTVGSFFFSLDRHWSHKWPLWTKWWKSIVETENFNTWTWQLYLYKDKFKFSSRGLNLTLFLIEVVVYRNIELYYNILRYRCSSLFYKATNVEYTDCVLQSYTLNPLLHFRRVYICYIPCSRRTGSATSSPSSSASPSVGSSSSKEKHVDEHA